MGTSEWELVSGEWSIFTTLRLINGRWLLGNVLRQAQQPWRTKCMIYCGEKSQRAYLKSQLIKGGLGLSKNWMLFDFFKC